MPSSLALGGTLFTLHREREDKIKHLNPKLFLRELQIHFEDGRGARGLKQHIDWLECSSVAGWADGVVNSDKKEQWGHFDWHILKSH